MSTLAKSISGISIIIEEIPNHVKNLKKDISCILFSYFLYQSHHPEWKPKEDLNAIRKSTEIQQITWKFHKDPKNHPSLLAYHGEPYSLDYILVITGKKDIEEIPKQDLAIALRPENQIAIHERRKESGSETSSVRALKPAHKKISIDNPETLKELERARYTNSQLSVLVNKYVDEGIALKDKAIEEVKSRDIGIERLQNDLRNAEERIRLLIENIRVQRQQISHLDTEKLELEKSHLDLKTERAALSKSNITNLELIERVSQTNSEQNNLIKTLENRNSHLENQLSVTLQEKQEIISKRQDEIHQLRHNIQEIQIEKQKLEREILKQTTEQKYLQNQIEKIQGSSLKYQQQIETLEKTNFALQSQIIAQKEYLAKESIETQDQFKALQEQNSQKQEQLINEIKRNYDIQFDKQLGEKIQQLQKTEGNLKSEKLQFEEQIRLEFQQTKEIDLQTHIREKEYLGNTIKRLEDTLTQKDQNIENLNSQINNLRKIHEQEMTTINITKDQMDKLEIETLKAENSELRQDLQNMNDQMRNLEATVKQMARQQTSPPCSLPPNRDRNPHNPPNGPPAGDPDDDYPDDDEDDNQPDDRGNYPGRPRRVPIPHDFLPNQNAPAKETIDIVPIFTGDTKDGAVNISEWTTKVDRARHWTKPEQHGLLLEKILTMKIKGRAQSCISNVDIYTYDQLKDVLVKRVNPLKSSLLLMNEMTACVHTNGTIQEHNTKFRRIYTSWLNAKRLELKQGHQTDEAISIYLQISDKDIIQTYLQNLREDTRAYLRTKDIYSLAQAEATAREHEDFKRSIQKQRGMFNEMQNQRRPEKSKFNREKSYGNKSEEKKKFFSMNKPNVHNTQHDEYDSDEEKEEEEESATAEEQQYQHDIRKFDLDSINTTDQMKEALEYVMVMNHPDRQCNYCKQRGHTELYCNQKKKDRSIPSPFNKSTQKKAVQKERKNFRKGTNQKRPPQPKVNTSQEEPDTTSDDESAHEESTSQQ